MKQKLLLWGIAFPLATLCFGQSTKLIHHTYYDLYYYPKVCSSIMGYYVQTLEHTQNLQHNVARIKFKPDPKMPNCDCAADLADEYSSYNEQFQTGPHTRDLSKSMDQGHINPFNAFTFDDNAGKETMLFTNVCPQIAHVNEHEWNMVEQEVTKRSLQYGNVKVWTGVLISVNNPKRVGTMYKPDWYWKVITYKKDGQQVEECWLSHNISSNGHTNASQAVKDVVYVRKLIKKYYPTFEPGFPLLN